MRIDPGGRPTKLTPSLSVKVCTMIRHAEMDSPEADIARVAELAGIHRVTFWRWKQRAAAGDQPYKTFKRKADAAFTAMSRREFKKAGIPIRDDYTFSAW